MCLVAGHMFYRHTNTYGLTCTTSNPRFTFNMDRALVQVVSTMSELFVFMRSANAVLDRPVGPELGGDTPRVLIEAVSPLKHCTSCLLQEISPRKLPLCTKAQYTPFTLDLMICTYCESFTKSISSY